MPATTPDPVTVDVLDVSDLRFAGGTSASMLEEVRAQHAAGWRTALAHLDGPLVARAVPVHPGLAVAVADGAAQLVLPDEPVEAGVVVLRHPAVAQHGLDRLPPVRTRHAVVVANAVPVDTDGHRHYDPAVVHRRVTERLGVAPVWAPISQAVRAAIADDVPDGALAAQDWVNVLDVDAWAVDRPGWAADRPVIGRHSRPAPSKWPTDAASLRAAYPVDGSVHVRVLGGADPAARLLGRLPSSWTVLPFGAVPPREFLAGLDFYVYVHDPAMVEGFGRTVLEAVASGLPALVPPSSRAVFGDAVLAVEPDQVRETVLRLYEDRDAYLAHVEHAQRIVRARFGYEAHVARLEPFLGPAPVPVASPVADDSAGAPAASSSVPAPPPAGKEPPAHPVPRAARGPRGPVAQARRVVRRRVLPRLRRSMWVRRVAAQVLLSPGAAAPERTAAIGTVVRGVGAEALPVALVVGAGLADEALAGLVRQVARTQLLTAAFRPVVVTDRPLPRGVDVFGYTVEVVDDVTGSLAALARAYRPAAVVAPDDGVLGPLHVAVLSALRPD